MKNNLNFSIQQKTIITPQLRQAIEVLQLSAQELQDMIQEEFLENPVLEFDTDKKDDIEEKYDNTTINIEDFNKYLNENILSETFYQDKYYNFEAIVTNKISLQEHLINQLELHNISADSHKIAEYLIGNIDDNGYLNTTVNDVAERFNMSIAKVEQVLKLIQGFEPDGIGAQNLQECLLIQAKTRENKNMIAIKIIEEYWNDIVGYKIKNIAKKLSCHTGEIEQAIDFIKTLNPKPGITYNQESVQYVVPDVVVKKVDDDFVVLVNDYGIPRLMINDSYKKISENIDIDTKKYLNNKFTAALSLMKSIEQRRNTLAKVMKQIVEDQHEFFESGANFLKPLTMRVIAEEVEIHESTVSRAVANKYADTPYGIMYIRNFFIGNILNNNNEEIATTKIKKIIKEIIMTENHAKPWADQDICEKLESYEINISRRTVAKYREQMGIASSSKRKHSFN